MAKEKDTTKEQQEQSDPKQDISPDYLIVMERRPQTLYPVASNKSIFITAVHPGMAEDDITAAMLPISWNAPGRTRGRKRNQPQEEETEVMMHSAARPAYAFVEKCRYQITDFRLSIEEDGKIKVRKYDSKNRGDNRSNREVYESILWMTKSIKSLGDMSWWDVVEGFLDSVAGRETDTAEDFDDLKKELPQLVSDM